MMRQATVSLNRQVIRLCKGILKAWEQWVDEVSQEELERSSDSINHKQEARKMTLRL